MWRRHDGFFNLGWIYVFDAKYSKQRLRSQGFPQQKSHSRRHCRDQIIARVDARLRGGSELHARAAANALAASAFLQDLTSAQARARLPLLATVFGARLCDHQI